MEQGIWVLVFRGTDGNAEFVEAVQADELNGKTYVYLTESSDACRLLILANPASHFYVGNMPYAFSTENFSTCLENKTLAYACEMCIRDSHCCLQELGYERAEEPIHSWYRG